MYDEQLEQLLQQASVDVIAWIPPVPPIVAQVHRALVERRLHPRRPVLRFALRTAVIALAVFALILIFSPDVREAVARFFGLDTVRIERIDTLPTPIASTTPDFAGRTTLADAQLQAHFEIRLPAYPTSLDDPQRVYLQEIQSGQQLILVYADFALYEIQGVGYFKGLPPDTIIEEITVAGERALWMSGAAHLVQIQNPDGSINLEESRIVDGNVLTWEARDLTYRIETQLPLEEALRIAESIDSTTQLAGLTSLSLAQTRARFDIRIAGDLGQPQRVYFQDFGRDFGFAQQVILVYPQFTLYEAEGAIYRKSIDSVTLIEEVQVGAQPGLWLTGGQHLIQLRNSEGQLLIDFRKVSGNVLAWESGGVTYRIETMLSLEETLSLAASIQ